LDTQRAGILSTVGAYTFWGLAPIYWKVMEAVPATQLLAHRIVWSAIMLAALVVLERRVGELARVFTSARVFLTLVATTSLIAVNWLTFIWAMTTERILEASLGYFINPLVTVLLAMVFLRERLTRGRWISMALAAAGVTLLALRVGALPWISLVLALSFGFYSLLRKTVRAEPEVGLLVETLLLSPWMILLLVRADAAGTGAFGHDGLGADLLLVAAGAVTALPLLLFTHGARRLPLATVGFLQYLAPSMQFLLAVGVYGETFTLDHLAAFLLIWVALALFTWDSWRRRPAALQESASAET
jgi:chloramphenicol-sensitive protein RarD